MNLDAYLRKMAKASLDRMAEADAREHCAAVAFEAGRFESYWLACGREAEENVREEHEQTKADAEGGGGGEGSGDQPAPGDGANDAVAPSEEDGGSGEETD